MPQKDSLLGRVIDGFEILEKKGEGSFASVYKARPVGLKNTFVALKVAHEGKEDRLRSEAEIYDRLQNHHNIIDIFKVNFGEGIHYIAMKYLPKSVRDVLNEDVEGIDYRKALNIALQAASALDYVHKQGLVHKDMKPEAILLDGTHVEIIDFNLSKIVQEQKTEKLVGSLDSVTDPQLSHRGGTIGYMSPEQERGEKVDGRSDIFSLGKVIYEMLTGRRPSANYTKPSKLIDAPKWIDELVDKALADDPKDRFQTAAALKQFIENGLSGQFDSKYVEVQAAPKKSGLQKFIGGLGKLAKGIAKAALYSPLLIAAAPLLPAYFTLRNTVGKDGGPRVPVGILLGLGGLIAYPFIAYSTGDYCLEARMKHELRSAPLQGKIAYCRDREICVFDAKDAVDKSRTETKLYPRVDLVSGLVWDKEGKSIYFVGRDDRPIYPENTKKDECSMLYNITLDGVQTRIANLAELNLVGSKISGTGTMDGQTVIFLEKDGAVAAIDKDGKKISRALKIIPQMVQAQKLSSDDKYQLRRENAKLDRGDVELAYNSSKWGDIDIIEDAKDVVWYHENK